MFLAFSTSKSPSVSHPRLRASRSGVLSASALSTPATLSIHIVSRPLPSNTDGLFTEPVARRLPASHLTGEANSGVIQANQLSAHRAWQTLFKMRGSQYFVFCKIGHDAETELP